MSSRELPEDLLTEILSKLPVKCLGRFKCVSKSWYALITNPNFIIKHVTWANSHNPHRRAILTHGDEWGNPRVSILSNTLELSGDGDLLQLFQHQVGKVQVFGACNGIICLAATLRKDGDFICGYEQLVLWNPATRESKMLPPIHRPSGLPGYFSDIGFGFDSKTNDYKVVRILHYNSQYEVAVYCLNADSWRVIDSSPSPSYSIHSSRYPSYVNGVDHWWASDTNDTGKGYRPFLLSFDMSNEVFQKVLLPPIEASLILDFAVINDSLALILRCDDELYYSFDIWVLNESGVERTWTKLLTIGRIPPWLWTLIQLREDGSVVLSDSNREGLEFYDPRTQEVRDLRIDGTGYCSELVSYTESIVFLNGWGDLLEHQDSS
jgi:F-box interacting protein